MLIKIMSAIPGAGKSTFVETHFPNAIVVSADAFWMVGGRYCFDKRRLSEAHDWCFRKYVEAVMKHCNDNDDTVIVVDNVNTSQEEIIPYYRIATAFKAKVEIIRLVCDPLVAFRRNRHEVPLRSIMEKHVKMQEVLPGHWPVTYVPAHAC